MSDSSIVALNIGSQTISMGVFTPQKNSLTLKKYATSTILADPANEALRTPQVKAAINKLVQDLGVEKSEAVYAVSGQSVFTRFVKLPSLAGGNIEQLVAFEAQQHVPYPIDEVAWDWEEMDAGGVEKEVAIVAIKKDLLNDLDSMVADSSLISKGVGSSPIALTNAFLHNYGSQSQTSLIIDIGAKSTNFIYVEGKRIFIRSVNIGGVSITNAISKEYQVDFPTAEKYKVETGRVALSGAYLQEWDEATSALATVISTALTRLPSEVARTTNFFRSQHNGSAPAQVYLAGAGSNLPYLKEFFEEKLRLPVSYFNPFEKLSLGKDVDSAKVSSEAHTFGELVGLALKADDKAALDIDLVPESIQERREDHKKRPLLITAAAALVVGVGAWAGYQVYASGVVNEKLAEVQSELKEVEPYEAKMSKLYSKTKKVDEVSEVYIQKINQRAYWVEILDELRQKFSNEFVWLTDLEPLVNVDTANLAEGEKRAYIDEFFFSNPYGKSSVNELNPEQLGSKKKSSKKKANQINAIKISGQWRANSNGQNVIYEIIENLRKSEDALFKFEVKEKKNVITLEDGDILKVQSTIDEGKLSAPFELTLPLTNPISL